jgi:hypothetical protein
MSDLGINMYDANGNMLGLSDMAGPVAGAPGRTHRGAAQLCARHHLRLGCCARRERPLQGGRGRHRRVDRKVNDAGYAHEQAAALTDNLAGDIERLGGALDTAFIKSGGAFTGILRDLAQGLTGVVNGASALMDVIGAIPGPILATVAAMGAFLALRGPLSTLFNGIADAATRMAFRWRRRWALRAASRVPCRASRAPSTRRWSPLAQPLSSSPASPRGWLRLRRRKTSSRRPCSPVARRPSRSTTI